MAIHGDTIIADEIAGAAREAGWDVAAPGDAEGAAPFLVLDCGPARSPTPRSRAAPGRSCARAGR